MTPYGDPEGRPYRARPSRDRDRSGRRPGGTRPHPRSTPKLGPRWARLSVIIGAVVMAVSGVVAVGPKLLLAFATKDIPIVEEALPDPPESIDGPINILLIGMDARAEDAGSEGSRADTIMIAHIPASHDTVYLVSLPRDLEVAIPAFPETGYGGTSADKINAAFNYGARQTNGSGVADFSPEGRGRGGRLTALTIDQLVPGGLDFNAMAIINFEGFLKILEAIGGVHMCVDEAVYSIHYYQDGSRPAWGDLKDERYGQGKYYPEDCYDMQAWEALDYARQRYGLEGSDYARQRHQQQLIKAMINKITSRGVLTDPGKLLELQSAAGDLLTLSLGGIPMEEWLFTLKDLRPDDLVMIKTNGGKLYNAGVVYENNQSLTPESLRLLSALSADTVGDFVAQHPDWVAADR